MRVLNHAHARNLAALLKSLPRATRDILLQPDRVPHFDSAVFRAGDKEKLVWRDGNVDDGGRVLDEMRDQSTGRSTWGAFARWEAGAQCSTSGNTDCDMRTELWQRSAICVEVDSLEEMLDAGVVTVCARE